MPDIRKMTIGQIVDFTIDYNKRMKRSEKESKKQDRKRKATQADINAFFG